MRQHYVRVPTSDHGVDVLVEQHLRRPPVHALGQQVTVDGRRSAEGDEGTSAEAPSVTTRQQGDVVRDLDRRQTSVSVDPWRRAPQAVKLGPVLVVAVDAEESQVVLRTHGVDGDQVRLRLRPHSEPEVAKLVGNPHVTTLAQDSEPADRCIAFAFEVTHESDKHGRQSAWEASDHAATIAVVPTSGTRFAPTCTLAGMERLSSKQVHSDPWLSVRQDEVRRSDGSTGAYSVVDTADCSLVIPLDGDRVHLVEQYRYPVGGRRWEFPSGSVDRLDTDASAVAVRELREETGLSATQMRPLGTLDTMPSTLNQRCTVFLAIDLTQESPQRDPEEQDMRSSWFARSEVERLITEGRISDAKSIAAYALLLLSEAASRSGG